MHALRRLAPLLFALAASPVSAEELYQWTDEDGVVRYTAQAERVPRSALAGAIVIRRDPATGIVTSQRLGEPGEAPVVVAAEPPTRPDVEKLDAPLPDVAAAPPPEPSAPEVPAPERWAIQLDTWPVSPWLEPLQELGLLDRHRLYRVTRQVDGQAWQRLRLGFFASPAAAAGVRSQLEGRFPDAWVDRVDATEVAASARESIAPPGRAVPGAEPTPRHGEATHGEATNGEAKHGEAKHGEATNGEATHGEARYAVQLLAQPADERLRALTRLELLDRLRLTRRTVEVEGEIWERLSLGPFPSVEAAEAVREQLAASYPDARIERDAPPQPTPAGAELALVR